MRPIKMRHMVMAMFLTLVLLSPAEAKRRPTVDNPNGDTCFGDPTTDKNCQGSDDGAICYCCYDDGCWICGITPLPGDECVWDPAYRTQVGTLPQTGPLITPQSGNRTNQEALINLLEKRGVVTKKELLEEMMRIRKADIEGRLEGGRLKESVAAQKRINRYFHTVVGPKLMTCWDRVQGKGTIEIQYRYEDNGKGGWEFKKLNGGKSSLPEGQDEVALACMQSAVAQTSFPKDGDAGDSFSISWNWPVPLPPDAAQQIERMLGSGGGEGGGCDGHGASAKCVTCSGINCITVCVGSDPPCTITIDPTPGHFNTCTEGGKCASGGPFGVVGGFTIY